MAVALRLPASRLLIWVSVPVRVTLLLPEPDTPAPVVPAVTVSVPETTESVAVTLAPPASTSPIDSPVPCRVRLVCSVAA